MARLPVSQCNLFFFDCETGGLTPREADMVEVACIVTDPTGVTVLEEYSAKVFPKKPVQPGAAKVNGYTLEKWASEAIELDHAMVKMLSLAQHALFVSHNVPFDWGFFELAMAKRYQSWPGDYHKPDTVGLAMPLLMAGKVPNIKLETLARYFGISHENKHTALGDVRACRGIYLKLMSLILPALAPLPAMEVATA
jgi:DNA polymerase III epsilon subunit-like protein